MPMVTCACDTRPRERCTFIAFRLDLPSFVLCLFYPLYMYLYQWLFRC